MGLSEPQFEADQENEFSYNFHLLVLLETLSPLESAATDTALRSLNVLV